jgi:hypothetical protein
MQVLLVLGLLWVIRHRKFADFPTGEGLLLVAAAVFFAMLSFFSNTQIGVGHILPVHAIFIIRTGICRRTPARTPAWQPEGRSTRCCTIIGYAQ